MATKSKYSQVNDDSDIVSKSVKILPVLIFVSGSIIMRAGDIVIPNDLIIDFLCFRLSLVLTFVAFAIWGAMHFLFHYLPGAVRNEPPGINVGFSIGVDTL